MPETQPADQGMDGRGERGHKSARISGRLDAPLQGGQRPQSAKTQAAALTTTERDSVMAEWLIAVLTRMHDWLGDRIWEMQMMREADRAKVTLPKEWLSEHAE